MDKALRILFAAGGTGGHVYPAIAIAQALQHLQPSCQVLFVGTRDRMEWNAVPAAGFEIRPLWISGLHRRFTLKNALLPLKLMVSLWQSLRLIRRFRPHALVSCGGFASGPPGWMAARMSVPLYVQEQNSVPGVTTRKLASSAKTVFVAFEEAGIRLAAAQTILTGNPVRRELIHPKPDMQEIACARKALGLDPERAVLLVTGGSGGARSINEALLSLLPDLLSDQRLQIIWQCGSAYYDELRDRLAANGFEDAVLKGVQLRAYLENMNQAWTASDMVVCRAGALTCAEIQVKGKPAILVPSPWVADDHQTRNARALADAGAALMVADEQLQHELLPAIKTLLDHKKRRQELSRRALELARPDAAYTIARHILNDISGSAVFADRPGTVTAEHL